MINLQSPGPIGLGELANLPDGNAILTLKDKNGESVNHKLWIDDFTSDLNMEIDITQLRSGYSFRPIRVQERVLTFTTIWSLANRPKYEALVEAIRAHWAYNFNELNPTPAYFTYFGANKTFAGFILNAERSYAVPDTLLSYSFDMKLMTSKINQYQSEVSVYSYYLPRPDNIKIDGIDGWYAITDLINTQTDTEEEVQDPSAFTQMREGGGYKTIGIYVDVQSKLGSARSGIIPVSPNDQGKTPLLSQNIAAGLAKYFEYLHPESPRDDETIQNVKNQVIQNIQLVYNTEENNYVKDCEELGIDWSDWVGV